jgi:hypothetical protein
MVMRAVLVVVGLLVATAAQAETRTCRFDGIAQPVKIVAVNDTDYRTTFQGKQIVLEDAGSLGTGLGGHVWQAKQENITLVLGEKDGLTVDGSLHKGRCK